MEIVYQCLEGYLHRFSGEKPRAWSVWLPLVEYWYNTNTHSSTKTSHFEAVYEFPPPEILQYVPGTTKVQAVNDNLKDQEAALRILKDNLQESQDRMKKYADLTRIE